MTGFKTVAAIVKAMDETWASPFPLPCTWTMAPTRAR